MQDLPVLNRTRRTTALSADAPAVIGRRPEWLKVPLSHGPHFKELKKLMREQGLHTICEEAACPNIGECWGEFRTASFLLLGDTCTRNCGFCDVKTGRPGSVDWGEPMRLAQAVQRLNLRHVVITSVTRDDLDDGGAAIFAATIRHLKRLEGQSPGVEVLIPDFQGNWDALAVVMQAGPDILNHNIETVPRLYSRVRPKAIYTQSLELLKRAKALSPRTPTKSGLMLGLGEHRDEVVRVFARPARQRRRRPHRRTVPAPQHAAPAGRAPRAARGVRGAEDPREKPGLPPRRKRTAGSVQLSRARPTRITSDC